MKNNMEKNFSKQNRNVMILTGLLAVLVMATVLFPIRKLDQITGLGNEMQYWGGAMTLLGQDWSSYMEPTWTAGYGYSFILACIIKILGNVSYAYKAAILVNGLALMTAYVISVATVRKILKKDYGYVPSIGCFLIILLPVYTKSKFLLGPEALLILIIWVLIALLYNLCLRDSKRDILLSAILLTAGCWLSPYMIVAAGGTCIFLWKLVREKRIEKRYFIYGTAIICIGIFAGTLSEQYLLYVIFGNEYQRYTTGIQTLITCVADNLSGYGIIGIIYSVFEKLYYSIVNTGGLILPAFYYLIEDFIVRKEKRKDMVLYTDLLFLSMFVLNVLILMGNGLKGESSKYSIGTTVIVIAPFLIMGLIRFFEEKEYKKVIYRSAAAFAVGTICINFIPNMKNHITGHQVDLGIMNLFDSGRKISMYHFYFISFIVIFMLVLAVSGVLIRIKQKNLKLFLWMLGICVFAGVCYSSEVFSLTLIEKAEAKGSTKDYQLVAELINGNQGNVYYFSNPDDHCHMETLQMFTDRKEIINVDEKEKQKIYAGKIVREKKKDIILTSSFYHEWENRLTGFRPAFITKSIILWTPENEAVKKHIDEILRTKEKKIPKVRNEQKAVYGEDLVLAPGTYTIRISLQYDKIPEDGKTGTVRIEDSCGELQSFDLKGKKSEEGKTVTVSIPFTRDFIMDHVGINIEKTAGTDLRVHSVSYRKESSQYIPGINHGEELSEILRVLQKADAGRKMSSTIGYMDAGPHAGQYDMKYLNQIFKNYNVEQIQSVDDITGEEKYLLFDNNFQNYYTLMDRYTVLTANRGYALLALTGSEACQDVEKLQGNLYSEGKKLDYRAFMHAGSDLKKTDEQETVQIRKGSYVFILDLALDEASEKSNGSYGKVTLYDGKTVLGKRTLYGRDMDAEQKLSVRIPFESDHDFHKIRYEITGQDGKVKTEQCFIELTGSRFILGKEDPESVQKIADLIRISGNRKLAVLSSEQDKKNKARSFEYLNDLLPETEIFPAVYKELMDYQDDLYILTYGYSTAYFNLVQKYTIVAMEGNYLLWARSDGKIISRAMEKGGRLLSSGTMISAECLMKLQDGKKEGLSDLYPGTYKMHMEVKVRDMDPDDTLEIEFVRDRTKEEYQRNIRSMKKRGYSVKEIEAGQDEPESVMQKEYSMEEWAQKKFYVSVELKCSRGVKNLRPVCSTWKNKKVSAKVVWVEFTGLSE